MKCYLSSRRMDYFIFFGAAGLLNFKVNDHVKRHVGRHLVFTFMFSF